MASKTLVLFLGVASTTLLAVRRRAMISRHRTLTNLRYDMSPIDMRNMADRYKEKMKKVFDEIASVSIPSLSFETVLKPLIDAENEYSVTRENITFMRCVSPDKQIRDESTVMSSELASFGVECDMRKDVYSVFKAYESIATGLTDEQKRFLEWQIRDGERNGLHLPENIREEVMELKKRLSQLSVDYQSNLNEESTVLYFSRKELEGMPENFFDGLKQTSDGKYEITLAYPHSIPISQNCSVEETRRQMEYAFNRRCIDSNTAILEEAIRIRARIAKILGYQTHSEYILEKRMAKSHITVMNFLQDLNRKLTPLAQEETNILLELKRKESEEQGRLFENKLNMWDLKYYMHKRVETEFSVNEEAIREYFPLDYVTESMLELYQTLLSLKFEQVYSAHVWHPEVKMYSVKDFKTLKTIGYFYLDLHPREGKYGHAACFPLQTSCLLSNGVRQHSVAAMVSNFTRSTESRPSLLTHDEVETFFHEFGHVMHHICSESDTVRFCGMEVERDFIEAPSQMLENWCWNVKSLRLLSRHYKTGEPIPDSLLQPLLQSRIANAGLLNKRQILFGLFDQYIHTRDEANTATILNQVHKEVGLPDQTPGTNFAASFTHMMGGYDAQYYGYLWSEVFSADMFETKFAADVLNQHAGLEYRNSILRPGATRDAAELLRDFLGRDPENGPFLRSKGLKIE